MNRMKKHLCWLLAFAMVVGTLVSQPVFAETTSSTGKENTTSTEGGKTEEQKEDHTDEKKDDDKKDDTSTKDPKDPAQSKPTEPEPEEPKKDLTPGKPRAFLYNLTKKFMEGDGGWGNYLLFDAGAQAGKAPYQLSVTVYRSETPIYTKEAQTDFLQSFALPLSSFQVGANTIRVQLSVKDANGQQDLARLIGVVELTQEEAKISLQHQVFPVLYKISYDRNGGSFKNPELSGIQEVQPGAKITLPEAGEHTAPKGKVFDRWEVLGKALDPKTEIEVTENLTIKALWKDAPIQDPIFQGVDRLGGARREDVAVEVSKKFFGKAEAVLLVETLAAPDAMSASNISQGRYPILFTGKNELYSQTVQEITRLGAKKVYVMGGTTTMPEAIVQKVQAIQGVEEVIRIGGKDRYEVCQKTLDYFPSYSKFVLANGLSTADALAAAPYAQKEKAPLVLIGKDGPQEGLQEALQGKKIEAGVLIGGVNTISQAGQKAMDTLLGIQTSRIDGKDRYAMAVNVAKTFQKPKTAFVANGLKWADALTAGPAAQKEGAPILLVKYTSYAAVLDRYLKETKSLTGLCILGGKVSISDGLVHHFKEMVAGEASQDKNNQDIVAAPDQTTAKDDQTQSGK